MNTFDERYKELSLEDDYKMERVVSDSWARVENRIVLVWVAVLLGAIIYGALT